MSGQIKKLYREWKSESKDSGKVKKSWKVLEHAEQVLIPEDKREEFQSLLVKHSDNIEYQGFLKGFQLATMLWTEGMKKII